MGRELAVHHFSTERLRSIEQRPLSHVAWSCRTTRHCPFLVPAMLPLTLFFDHPRKAKPSMNGLTQRTCELTSSLTNCCALSPTPGRNRISLSVAKHSCRRDAVLGGAVASRVPHPQTGDGYCLGTVELHHATQRCIELALRAYKIPGTHS